MTPTWIEQVALLRYATEGGHRIAVGLPNDDLDLAPNEARQLGWALIGAAEVDH